MKVVIVQWGTAKRDRTPKRDHLEILLFCFEIKTFVIRDAKYVVNHREKWYCIKFGNWVNCIFFAEKAKNGLNWHYLCSLVRIFLGHEFVQFSKFYQNKIFVTTDSTVVNVFLIEKYILTSLKWKSHPYFFFSFKVMMMVHGGLI